MNYQGSFGLQWRLAALHVASLVVVISAGIVAASVADAAGAPVATVIAMGALAAAIVGGVSVYVLVRYTQALKIRLWEAADMAEHIAQGDYSIRLQSDRGDDLALLEGQLNQMAQNLGLVVGELQSKAEQNRRLAEEAGRGAALEERAKLARDLHDTVNQQLFALALRLAAASKQLEKQGGPAADLVPELQSLESMTRQAHAETRGLILQLRPTTLEQNGLGAALAEYASRIAGQEGWQFETEGLTEGPPIFGEGAEVLFRVAQEALHNAAKHAVARAVKVNLGLSGGMINLSVADDGRGFDPRKPLGPTSFGLLGMRERLTALGGTLTVTSEPGHGTTVTASIPVRHAQA